MFYERLNRILTQHGFDAFVEQACQPFYAEKQGRLGLAPGIYFRTLFVGYTRILGKLKKLGIKPPSRNTVKNILKANGLEPGPKRGAGTWDEFLKIQAATLWQCDFYARSSCSRRRGYGICIC